MKIEGMLPKLMKMVEGEGGGDVNCQTGRQFKITVCLLLIKMSICRRI